MKKLLHTLFISCFFMLAFSTQAQQTFTFTSEGTKFKLASNTETTSVNITIFPAVSENNKKVTTIVKGITYTIKANEKYTVTADFTKLDLYKINLTSLDVSKLSNLKELRCAGNKLTNLTASNLSNLTYLSCWNNKLTSLDVSGLTNLETLFCNENEITDLNLSELTKLKELKCYVNKLKSIDVSNSSLLSKLYCYNNDFTACGLDAIFISLPIKEESDNAKIYIANKNNIDGIHNKCRTNIANAKNWKVYDLNDKETEIEITNNEFTCAETAPQSFTFISKGTTFTLKSGTKFTSNITISPAVLEGGKNTTTIEKGKTYTIIANTEYTVTGDFTKLVAYQNTLSSLDVSGLTNLQSLDCSDSKLSSLNVSGLTNLYRLDCDYNQLSSLDVSGLTNLQILVCNNNQISSLDISELTKLNYLNCSNNQLSSLNVSGLTKLDYLNCSNNQLSSLNVSGLTKLQELSCNNIQLSSLDVSGLTNLQRFYCENNQLSSLDVSGLTNLQRFYCENNQLIDIRNIKANKPQYVSTLNGQQISIPMQSDGKGGFESINTYPTIEKNHTFTIANANGSGVTFAGGKFKCNTIPSGKIDFSTDIGWDNNISGKLDFYEAITTKLNGTKTLKGKDLEDEQFEFQVLDDKGSVVASAKNKKDGNFSIEIPVPKKEGTYNYTLKEKNEAQAGYTYDTKVYSVEVKVSKDKVDNNKLNTTVVIKDGANTVTTPEFKNTYTPYFTFTSKAESFILQPDTKFTGNITISPAVLEGGKNTTTIEKGKTYTIIANTEYTVTGDFTILFVYLNNLSSLDVSGLTNLQSLDCRNNQLSSLNVSGLTNLYELYCSGNKLSSLDVSGLTNLDRLECNGNQLSSLDVSGLTKLGVLSCENNQLSSLDVSGVIELLNLVCSDNQLSSLDVSGVTKLGVLSCENNQLSSLDVSGLTNLYELYCSGNKLSSLDVSGLTNLQSLNCQNNQLIDIRNVNSIDPYVPTLANQNISIPMQSDGKGNFESINTYPTIEKNHTFTIANANGSGVTFADGKFKCNTIPSGKIDFSTDIGWDNNISGKLDFYEAITAKLNGTKTLKGKELEDEQFEFQVLDDKGSVVASAKSKKDGNFSIEIPVPKKEGTYNYTLKEKNETQAGYTYDTKVYSVEVKVTKDKVDNNKLNTTAVIKDGATIVATPKFENTYTPYFTFTSKAESFILEPDTEVTGNITISPAVLEGGKNTTTIENGKTYTIIANTEYTVTGDFTKLVAYQNTLSSLDVSGLTNLQILACNNNQLSSLDVSELTNLQELYCNGNQLSSLDVSGLTNLQNLNCNNNQLSSLDVSGLTKLESLYCNNNQISSLDISGLTKLGVLSCNNNQLSSLDVSGLTNLQILACNNNQLNSLDVSGLTNLQQLYCNQNQLSSLDVSGLTNLVELECQNNQLIDIRNVKANKPQYVSTLNDQKISIPMQSDGKGGFESINTYHTIENNHTFTIANGSGVTFADGKFRCSAIPSGKIDFSTDIGWGESKKLSGELTFYEAITAKLNGTKTLKGKELEDEQFEFQVLDDKGSVVASAKNKKDGNFSIEIPVPKTAGTYNYTLKEKNEAQAGYTYDTKVYSVEVKVTKDEADNNKLNTTVVIKDGANTVTTPEFKNTYTPYFTFTSEGTTFGLRSGTEVTGNITISPAVTENNKIVTTIENGKEYTIIANTEYTVTGDFTELVVYNNTLSSLDVSGLTNLTTLNCNSNLLSSLDVSRVTNLDYLDCGGNQLSSLDVSGLTKLVELICGSNLLSSLDVSGLTKLTTLDCSGNKISSLDVSGVIELQTLWCSNNQISSLDVSGVTNLQSLDCQNNQLSSLDVSGLTNLEILVCNNNQLSSLDVSGLTKLEELECQNNQLIDIRNVNANNPSSITTLNDQKISIPMQSDGKGGFESINTYPTIEKNHTFTIANGSGVTFADGKFKCNTIPSGEISFSTDIGWGESKKLSGELTFYEVIKAELNGTKTLKGKELEDEQFEFQVLDDKGSVVASAKNKKDGNFSIEIPVPKKEGTYNYTLKEKNEAQTGYTYDTKVYSVEVKVSKDKVDNNKLNTTVVIKDGANTVTTPEFKNTYKEPTPISVKISGTKTVNNKPASTKDQFEFELFEGSTIIAKAKNKADGSFEITTPALKQGTYNYTLKEKNDAQVGYTYDTKEYAVNIVVSLDTKTNTLSGKVIIKEGANTVTTPEFKNTYKEPTPISVKISGTKTLNNKPASTKDQFEFELFEGSTIIAKAKNKADGSFEITTPALKEGTYNYTLKEKNSAQAGYTYDTKVYAVNIVVSLDTKTNTLSGKVVIKDGANTVTTPEFKNTYKEPTPISVKISGTKTVNNKPASTKDQFEFELFEGNKQIAKAKNKANGSFEITAPALKEGTYNYTLKEKNDAQVGYTYDTKVYAVNIVVSLNSATNTLSGKVVIKDGANTVTTPEFKNTYKEPTPISVKISGTKTLNNKPASTKDQFEFELFEGSTIIAKAKNKANGSFEITTPVLKQGTYNYTLKEKNSAQVGYTYDTKVYAVNIVVSLNSETNTLSGKVVIKDGANTVTTPEFKNTYKEPTPISVKISGTKTLNNKPASTKDQFEFELFEGSTIIAKAKNKANGTFEITTPALKQGTYNYTLKEKNSAQAGYTYDTKVYAVNIVVSLNSTTNTLSGKVVIKDGTNTVTTPEFKNTYKEPTPISVKISGTKTVNNKPASTKDQFEFELFEGNKQIAKAKNKADGSFEITTPALKQGTYNYTLKEKNSAQAGYTYDTKEYAVNIVVSLDTKTNTLSGKVVIKDGANTVTTPEFKNTYKEPTPISVKISGTKTVNNKPASTKDQFEFELFEGSTIIAKAKNKADGSFEITTPALKQGTYNYTLKEKNSAQAGYTYDTKEYAVNIVVSLDTKTNTLSGKVIIKDGANTVTTPEFKNTYKEPEPIAIKLNGKKTLIGETLKDKQFEFELFEGSTIIAKAKNKADGSFEITTPKLKEGTYNYTLKEKNDAQVGYTYDTKVYAVNIVVSLDTKTNTLSGKVVIKDGTNTVTTPEFKNTYKEPEPIAIKLNGKKTLIGETLKDKQFEFELFEGSTIIAKAKNKANGTFEITTPALKQGTYNYTLKEKNDAQVGYTYDTKVYAVNIVVSLDTKTNTLSGKVVIKDGTNTVTTPEFKNTYKEPTPISVKISGTKTVNNKPASTKDQFEFELFEGSTIIAKAKNKADGSFEITTPALKQGTYNYTLKEKNDAQSGYTYDTKVYAVNIVVSLNSETNTLSGKVVIKDGTNTVTTPEFKNTYKEPTPISIKISGTKTVNNKPASTKDQFEFELFEGSTIIAKAKNNANGSFDITTPALKQGTYNYTLKEKNSAQAGYTYDTKEYAVNIVVSLDTKTNTLSEKVEIKDGANTVTTPEFKNNYKEPTPISVKISGTKTVNNKPASTKDQFEFELFEGSTIIAKAKNKANGTFEITTPALKEGTYNYTLKEKNDAQVGYTYDTKVYAVNIVVSLNSATNTLSGKIVIKDGTNTVTTPEFKNTYTTAGIEEFNANFQLRVYPNPVVNELQIVSAETILEIYIYDINGRLLINKSVNDTHITLPTSELNRGMHILRVKTDKGFKNVKIVKE